MLWLLRRWIQSLARVLVPVRPGEKHVPVRRGFTQKMFPFDEHNCAAASGEPTPHLVWTAVFLPYSRLSYCYVYTYLTDVRRKTLLQAAVTIVEAHGPRCGKKHPDLTVGGASVVVGWG